MKNILIVDDCLVKGEPVSKGDVLENLDNGTAAILLSSGRAVLYKGEVEKQEKTVLEKDFPGGKLAIEGEVTKKKAARKSRKVKV